MFVAVNIQDKNLPVIGKREARLVNAEAPTPRLM